MQKKLLNYLACPDCKNSLSIDIFLEKNDDVIEGVLYCNCSSVFPVTGSIPRIVKGAFKRFPSYRENFQKQLEKYDISAEKEDSISSFDELCAKTELSFGYQWTNFSEMACDFKQNFLNYIKPVDEYFFKGKLGLDAGCGFGRHIYNAANFGAEMVGIDVSDAIESTHKNTKHLKNIHLVQCDIYQLPFKDGLFDFVYSIGVLHHLPEPEKAFKALTRKVKERGSIFIWVYSKKRTYINAVLEIIRYFTHKIPFSSLKVICWFCAVVDYLFFIKPYKILKDMHLMGKSMDKIVFSRVKLYAKYPFQVVFADWFDRLSPPIRYYYDEKEMNDWLDGCRLKEKVISPTGLYGWRAMGKKKEDVFY
ncbi:MAG: methyltransferase domain-containing protein [Nitrospinae bacterium]|nr:methyltransferase domain-containing protein [Nitrospinota bacterium]